MLISTGSDFHWGREHHTATDWELHRDQTSGFSCPKCKESLLPVTAEDRFAFAFGCSAGHRVSLDELFEQQTGDLRRCFEGMIGTWEKSILQMSQGAEIAGRLGSQDLSHRLRQRVAALEARVLLFRKTFLKHDSDLT